MCNLMEQQIINYIQSKGSIYELKIPEESIKKIYELLINDNFIEPTTDIEYYYYGWYYEKKYNWRHENKKEKENMLKYYLMSIEEGNSYSMFVLGHHYKMEGDTENMIKYFLMAAENGCERSMINLGNYYSRIGDKENMIKYYLMAIEKGNGMAMNNLGYYYMEKEDRENAIKYYLMAIEKGDITAINNLTTYCECQKNYIPLAQVYYTKKKYKKLEETIGKIIINEQPLTETIVEYILECCDKFSDNCHPTIRFIYNLLKTKIDLMELHFKYSEQGKGFQEAKTDFIKQLTGE